MKHSLTIRVFFGFALALIFSTARAAVGDLYVTANAHTTNASLIGISPAGLQSPVANGLSRPYGMAIDSEGNIYTSETSTGIITKTTPNGLSATFVSGLTSPRGMAFDPLGNLIVATGSSITQITPGGTATAIDTFPGTAWDVAFDTAGRMYVTDLNFRRVYKYDAQGQKAILATLPSGNPAYGLAVATSGDVIVTSGTNHSVWRVASNGVVTEFFTGDTSFQPVGIDINAAGDVYISSFGTISRYSASGTLQGTVANNLVFSNMIAFQQVPEPSTIGLLLIVASAAVLRRPRRLPSAGVESCAGAPLR